jgi:hypothetical protein
MSRKISPSSGRAHGLGRSAQVRGVTFATVCQRRRPAAAPTRRPGPHGPMSDAGLVKPIRAVLAGSGFSGEGYRKLWARLRFRGSHTSCRRVLRPMREHGWLAYRCRGAVGGPRAREGTIVTERVGNRVYRIPAQRQRGWELVSHRRRPAIRQVPRRVMPASGPRCCPGSLLREGDGALPTHERGKSPRHWIVPTANTFAAPIAPRARSRQAFLLCPWRPLTGW